MASFIWDDKNTAHIAKHGISPEEAEHVVVHAHPPYPRQHGDRKIIARGRTEAGEYVQVIYVMETEADIDYSAIDLVDLDTDDEAYYVIHARPLSKDEIRSFRR